MRTSCAPRVSRLVVRTATRVSKPKHYHRSDNGCPQEAQNQISSTEHCLQWNTKPPFAVARVSNMSALSPKDGLFPRRLEFYRGTQAPRCFSFVFFQLLCKSSTQLVSISIFQWRLVCLIYTVQLKLKIYNWTDLCIETNAIKKLWLRIKKIE